MNKTIEKILFLSPNQLRKWGKLNGWASILAGLLVVGAAIAAYSALTIVSENAHTKFLEVSLELENLNEEQIQAIFSPLARLVAIISCMFGFSGAVLILYGIQFLKLYEMNRQKTINVLAEQRNEART